MKLSTFIVLICLTGISTLYAQKDNRLTDVSSLKGKNITDPQGQDLGTVERLLIEPANGRIRYLVVEVNKAWKWNEPKVAVPFQVVKIQRQEEGNQQQGRGNQKQGEKGIKLVINATKEKLEKAPKFKDIDSLERQEAAQFIYRYWGASWHNAKKKGSMGQESSMQSSPHPTASPNSTASPNQG